jgi:hypothetical protein
VEVQESWWKWTSEVQDQVEHLIEGAMDHQEVTVEHLANGSSGSRIKWQMDHPDRAENGSSGSAGLAEQ